MEDYDLLRAESKLQLNNWFYEHVRSKVAVTNDLPFDVEVRWESTASPSVPKTLIEIPRGKTADIDTFESHHLRFYKRDVRENACLPRSSFLHACGLRPGRCSFLCPRSQAQKRKPPLIHPPTQQGRATDPVLRVRMTGAPTLRLSDYVHNDMTGECTDPDECANSASDEVQLNVEVRDDPNKHTYIYMLYLCVCVCVCFMSLEEEGIMT